MGSRAEVSIKSPLSHQIPLNPPFSKGEVLLLQRGALSLFPPFDKGGRGGILLGGEDLVNEGDEGLLVHL